jgi:hypothetical protein
MTPKEKQLTELLVLTSFSVIAFPPKASLPASGAPTLFAIIF